MPISPLDSLLIILVVSVTTFITRAIPFAIFSKEKEPPKWVRYLGKMLPPAVIGMLIIYCLKEVNVLSVPFGLPELISIVIVVILHLWKRNNLLSIGTGTVVYMVLIQTVFSGNS